MLFSQLVISSLLEPNFLYVPWSETPYDLCVLDLGQLLLCHFKLASVRYIYACSWTSLHNIHKSTALFVSSRIPHNCAPILVHRVFRK